MSVWLTLVAFANFMVWSLPALQTQQDGLDGICWPCKLVPPTSVCVEPANLQHGLWWHLLVLHT